MKLKNDDIIKVNGVAYMVVATMETQSKENYILLNCLNDLKTVVICKQEKNGEEDVLTPVENEYLATKLKQSFDEILKERLLKEHKIKIVNKDEEK